MIPYIDIQHLAKRFGDLELYGDLSFTVNQGDKCGLLARNGAGKTTLLNILAGREEPDGGAVVFRNGISVGYLEQDPVFPAGATVLETIYHDGNELSEAVKAYEKALFSGDQGMLGHAMERMDALSAWEYENHAKIIFTRLKIGDLARRVDTLSGGEKKRLALAMLLVRDPDVYILDEPTNHIDLDMAEWLEDYLAGANKTLLMVTHDRYFLDRVCNRIFEIDQKELYAYQGGYTEYVAARDARIEQFRTETEKARNIYRRELEWMRRMPQARGTKAKYRKDAFFDIKEKAFARRNDETVRIDLKTGRIGTKIFEAKDVSFAFGDKKILDRYTYTFTRYERLGIVGKNGTGKSTFLNLLTGAVAPDSGTLEIGPTVQFGYYRQQETSFDPDSRIIDIVKEIAEVVTLGNGKTVTASQFLNMFLFPPETQYGVAGKLSGGERRRLYLLTVLMRSPNFLVLDEPTNDLDIVTLNILEEYLENFGGCLIVVSHDRYFLDKVADQLLVFEGNGKVRLFTGNYTQYRNRQEEEQESLKRETEKPKEPEKNPRTTLRERRLTFKERRELEELTGRIAGLEDEKRTIETALNGGTADAGRITELSKRYTELKEELDTAEMRWLELSEIEA